MGLAPAPVVRLTFCAHIAKPETVMARHCRGFRLQRTWKGRPEASREIRDLIRKMSRANLLWGAPHIDGELLVRQLKPLSNHEWKSHTTVD